MVTFPPLCASKGLMDTEGFTLLSSAVGNVQCNKITITMAKGRGCCFFSFDSRVDKGGAREMKAMGVVLKVDG